MGDEWSDRFVILTEEHEARIGGPIDSSQFMSSFIMSSAMRMVDDRLTDDRRLKAQKIEAERLQFEAAFKNLLSESGISEYEYLVVVSYVRERFSDGRLPSRSDIEQRILATRPAVRRHPETVDIRGRHIGVFPAAEAVTMGLAGVAEIIGKIIKAIITDPKMALSLYLDFLPVIGDIKGMIEAATGKDLITGENLPNWVRAVNFAFSAHGCAKLSWKLTKAGIRTTAKIGSRIAAEAITPVVVFAAISGKAPADTMRLIKNVAAMDQSALIVAAKRAEDVASGAVKVSEVEIKAVQNLKLLLSPNEIAAAEKAAAKKATQKIDKAAGSGSGKNVPVTPPDVHALPAKSGGTGRAGRKPKTKTKPKSKGIPKGKINFSKSGAMKELAGKIHGLDRLEGQTVAVIELKVDERTVYAAASNSGANAGKGFSPRQKAALKATGLEEIQSVLSEVVHAEVNVLSWITKLRKEGKVVQVIRWGVSSGRLGHRICDACRVVMASLGGLIEEYSAMVKTP